MGPQIREKENNLIGEVLRRATKIIHRMKDLEYQQRPEKAKIPSMRYRPERRDMIEVYKYTHGSYNTPPPFTLEADSTTRGHQHHQRTPT